MIATGIAALQIQLTTRVIQVAESYIRRFQPNFRVFLQISDTVHAQFLQKKNYYSYEFLQGLFQR
jgi:hypothetical protein